MKQPTSREVRAALQRWIPSRKLDFRDGWDDRGRLWSNGIRAVVAHHTSSPIGDEGARQWFEARGEAYPYCNALVLADGTVRVCSALSAWGSGAGGPWDRAGVPRDLLHLMGFQVELESPGIVDDLKDRQITQLARIACAIREVAGRQAFPNFSRLIRHRDWTDGTAGVSPEPLPTLGRKNDVLRDIRPLREAARITWRNWQSTGNYPGE